MKKHYIIRRAVAGLSLLMLISAAVFYLSPAASGQQERALLQQDLERVLTSYDELLDPSDIHRQVRQTERLSPVAQNLFNPAAPVATKGGSGSKVFIFYRAPNGETACREATTEEQLNLLRPDRDNPDRVLIYSGGRPSVKGSDGEEIRLNPVTRTASGQALLPSAGMNVVLHGTTQLNNNAAARDAFIVAANRWEALISTQITVVFDVDFGPTFFGQPYSSPTTLGATATEETTRRLSATRQQLLAASPVAAEATLYNTLPGLSVPTEISGGAGTASGVRLTRAQARALGLVPDITNPDALALGQGDARIGFNSAHNFDFNPNDGIAPGSTDFDAVVVHEIGHALGFVSESGIPLGVPAVLDIFRFRPGVGNAGNLATVASAPRVMVTGGTQVFFNNRLSTFSGNELGLSTGGPSGNQGDGRQSSHWKADEQTGIHIGIMDPTISSGVREVVTDNDRLAFDTLGYRLDGMMVLPPAAPPSQPPVNDNFANAIGLSGLSGSIIGDIYDATGQAGEPNHASATGSQRQSVWYIWTAPVSGQTNFNTSGSDYDTVLGIYTGGAVNSLTLIGANDDVQDGVIRHSTVTFNAVAGTTYRIAVDGFDTETGAFKLNWSVAGQPESSFQFNAASFAASEGANAMTMTVTRTGNLTGEATVEYATTDDGATERKDYTAALGRLRFAPGETQKTFNIIITDDRFDDDGESFTVTLNSSNGATLGAQNATNISITDNDATDGPSPVKEASFNVEFFVRQHYADFLNRVPDQDGLNFWIGQTTGCGSPDPRVCRINVSAAFFLSIENQETGYLAHRAYKVAYGNLAGKPVPLTLREYLAGSRQIGDGVQVGVGNWQQQLEANKVAFFNEFVTTTRFTSIYNSLTNTQYVTMLNGNAGGALSPAEHNALVNALNGGTMTRAQVLRAVAEDADLTAAERNRAFVLAQYFGYLRRNPDEAGFSGPDPNFDGYNFWLDKLNQFNGNFVRAEMVRAFIESIEYGDRFGQ